MMYSTMKGVDCDEWIVWKDNAGILSQPESGNDFFNLC